GEKEQAVVHSRCNIFMEKYPLHTALSILTWSHRPQCWHGVICTQRYVNLNVYIYCMRCNGVHTAPAPHTQSSTTSMTDSKHDSLEDAFSSAFALDDPYP